MHIEALGLNTFVVQSADSEDAYREVVALVGDRALPRGEKDSVFLFPTTTRRAADFLVRNSADNVAFSVPVCDDDSVIRSVSGYVIEGDDLDAVRDSSGRRGMPVFIESGRLCESAKITNDLGSSIEVNVTLVRARAGAEVLYTVVKTPAS